MHTTPYKHLFYDSIAPLLSFEKISLSILQRASFPRNNEVLHAQLCCKKHNAEPALQRRVLALAHNNFVYQLHH